MIYNPKRREANARMSKFKLEVIESANRVGVTPMEYIVSLIDLAQAENYKKLPKTAIHEK